MHRRVVLLTATSALLFAVLLISLARAEELTSTQVAEAFWNAFLNAQADEMGAHYAPQVLVKAGSEMLKPEYGVNASGDRTRDHLADRKALIHGYKTMFHRVGKAKWIESAQKLRGVQMSFITASDNNKYFSLFQANSGELLVQLHTDPEPLFFLLRQDASKRWSVVAEAFD